MKATTQTKTKVKAKAKAKPKAKVVEGAAKIVPMGAVALRSLTLKNVLSFGAEAKVELGPLNVLIGSNGCGKSNLLDVVALLKAAATADLSDEFRGGGLEWPWKGEEEEAKRMKMESEWNGGGNVYCHDMTVDIHETGAYSIDSEWLGTVGCQALIGQEMGANSRRSILRGGVSMWVVGANLETSSYNMDNLDDLRRDVSAAMSNVWVYRNRYVGRGRGPNPLRAAGRADGEKWRIPETLDDFAMVLNRVYPECGDAINEKMREFYEDARKVHFSVFDGAVQIKLEEAGGRIIPAQRMSDGMLNWLFMLTILLDPKPPALVCIEEPETGLHPDMLPTLARMLIDASKRMQLIVTTHSDMILDCFTNMPEAVVVCDKVDGVTQMTRLCAKDFREWKKEGLGMAWISGAIGGKRW